MVIFACGVITGAIVTKTVTAKAEELPQSATSIPGRGAVLQMQKVLDQQLDLTAEQRDQIERIMKASRERTQPLWEKIAPQMNEEVKRVRGEIRDVLTPEQWKKFGELMKRNRRANTGGGQPSKSVDAVPAPAPASTN
jgi:Spy/CpxP family protein refolding chaperone